MSDHTRSHVYLSAFMCSVGTLGGWLITNKLAGGEASSSLFWFGTMIMLLVFGAQITLFGIRAKRTIFLILFNAVFSMSLVWFMLCLVLPILWMPNISVATKFTLSLFAVVLCSFNMNKGIDEFSKRWKCVEDQMLGEYYDRITGLLDWDGLVGKLELSLSIYIPGFPKKLEPVLSVAIVVSMLLGLSLRNIFPHFSVFAWGIPSLIVISLFMQMVGVCLGQLLILRQLEKRDKLIIRPK